MKAELPESDCETGHKALFEQNAILLGANENLLLATLSSEDLRLQSETQQRQQNEFLAMLAHELRNPLAPISMASTMLGRLPAPSPELLQIQSIIDRQVRHLSCLLDDLLDAARISSGKIELHLQPLLVADQVTNALHTVEVRLAERHQKFILKLPETPICISGDAVRLAQVFSNLLVNASKFTQDGGQIVLEVVRYENEVAISVSDNGVGIAANVLPNIFTLFTQGPRTLARTDGGLGVGLNIVRTVIEMHGGSVSATSLGLTHGSTFTLTLPALECTDTRIELLPNKAPILRRNILVVEDNRDASEMLEMILRSENHVVTAAYDGLAGLELACEGSFDIVLCDVGLPGIDGYDLVRSLRAKTGASAPFCVAISGYGQPEDRTHALDAGFDQHLVKPIQVDDLLNLIAVLPARRAHVE